MKQSQVSISLSGASQLATDTAQIILLNQGIRHLPRLIELAGGFNVHMKRQLFPGTWPFGVWFKYGATGWLEYARHDHSKLS